MYPNDLKYSDEHEWVRISAESNDHAEIGITNYAQDSLGDVVFVEMPEIGAKVTQFDKFGEIESVKAVSDLFSPVSGTITHINEALIDSPELINNDPYGDGWVMKVKLDDPSELDQLMDAETYTASLG